VTGARTRLEHGPMRCYILGCPFCGPKKPKRKRIKKQRRTRAARRKP